MIVVHHLNNSRSQRVLWLLEELGLDYEVRRYERDPKTLLAPPALLAVHPLGKSPVITDGGLTIAESGAIVEYLLDAHGADSGLRPPRGTGEGRRYTYWLHFAEGSAMPPLLMKLVFAQLRKSPMPFFARPVARRIADRVLHGFVDSNLARQLAFMEAEIAQHGPWFAGAAFSAADIQMSFPVEAAAKRAGVDAQSTPALAAWLARVHARPAYRRALERGGPYDYA
ncbi:MAG TPA: glutathione S-transferase [Burkholderiaceae bacterium]